MYLIVFQFQSMKIVDSNYSTKVSINLFDLFLVEFLLSDIVVILQQIELKKIVVNSQISNVLNYIISIFIYNINFGSMDFKNVP